ncbi:MAG: 50S ribosomal protein L25/general stress protein Ctc [Myxococcaceae bacterium]|jgi:large subunit ribosomal protein L25|nr:50S ribosomal protein L25/general stress protein Ctc [Myxococcaceae bacterium]
MALETRPLSAKVRTGAGKGFARRTRAAGLVPAVVYGPHLDKPLNIAVDAKETKAAIQTPRRMNTVLGLSVEGRQITVLLKEFQLDPVTKELLHVDFIDVRENEQVKVKIPLILTGKAEGVTNGGILSQVRREVEVWALPAAIPEKIEVDVTPLKIGGSLHINEVKLPQGVTVKSSVNFTIAVVTAPEVEKVAEPVAAAAAPGAAPAGGDAKAGDAKAGDAKAGDGKAAPAAAAKAPAKK